MNLVLESLLWVLPGICFIFAYNRLRDVETVEFTGWPYVFFIVLIGVVTILPLKLLLGESLTSDKLPLGFFLLPCLVGFALPFIIKWIFIPLVQKLEQEPNFFIPSNMWSVVYFFFPLENRDKFIKHCIKNEGEAFLITVDEPLLYMGQQHNSPHQENEGESKNFAAPPLPIPTRVYLGILMEFPYVATSSIESQVIRILPLLAGYSYVEQKNNKDSKDKKYTEEEKIKWTQKYNPTEDSQGMIIPRGKIIHFCLYDEDLHKALVFNNS